MTANEELAAILARVITEPDDDTNCLGLNPIPDVPLYYITRSGLVLTKRKSSRNRSGQWRKVTVSTNKKGYG